jgi:hypothetical protein
VKETVLMESRLLVGDPVSDLMPLQHLVTLASLSPMPFASQSPSTPSLKASAVESRAEPNLKDVNPMSLVTPSPVLLGFNSLGTPSPMSCVSDSLANRKSSPVLSECQVADRPTDKPTVESPDPSSSRTRSIHDVEGTADSASKRTKSSSHKPGTFCSFVWF